LPPAELSTARSTWRPARTEPADHLAA
jgi:hypothetical protein